MKKKEEKKVEAEFEDFKFGNFNEANIADVRKHINEEAKNPSKQAYVMVQPSNGPVEVKIPKKNYEIGAKFILK